MYVVILKIFVDARCIEGTLTVDFIIQFDSDLPLYVSVEELSFGDVHSIPGHSQFQLFCVLTAFTGDTFTSLTHTRAHTQTRTESDIYMYCTIMHTG